MTDINTPEGSDGPRKIEVMRSKRIRLGRGYAVQFGFCDGALSVQFEPAEPTGENKRIIMPAYLKARDNFVAQAASLSGLSIGIVGLDGSASIIVGGRS